MNKKRFELILLGQYLTLFLAVAGFMPTSFAQIKPILNQGQTRAVIVGISNYQNNQITDLRFADADAKALVEYLKSDAGGKVSDSNIQVLVNEKATLGNIVSALTWLVEESKTGDQVIIYFSGHGDMESLSGMSFLLAFDASAITYSGGGGFPVVILQSIVKKLSTQNQVQVLLITDACRSGKLAGNEIGGSQATSKILSDQFANELKILSCQPNEYSMESTEWGGGRGVFSYYLIKGLSGLADQNKDLEISLLELGWYLESKVPTATAPHSQIPMTAGMKSTIIAHVDPKTLEKLQKNEQGTTNESTEPKVNKNPSVQDTTDEQLKLMFETAMSNGHLLTPLEGSAYQYFQKLKARPSQQSYSNLIRRDLAAELQNEAQGAINDYLAADPRELRKRWSFDDRYEKFPEYLSKSAELLGNEHFMYTRLKSREKYFHGLNLRLKGEKLNDKNLFQEAKIEQEEAIKLDSSASFAYNELGHLAILLGEYSKSLEYLNKCTQLSPKWVLPWSNMCSNFIEQGNLEQAEYFGLKAIALDSTFVMANYNLALVYRRQNNHQKSIQYNKAALQYDKDYAKAYFNLGLSYYHLEDYKNAEAAWEQYRQRMPDDPDIYQCLGEIAVKNGEQMNAEKHFNRALFLDPKYDGAFFSLGELYFTNQDLSSAEKAFQNYVALKPNDAEGFYQLARVYAQTKQVERALNSLESAFKLGKTDKQKVMGDEKLSPILSLQAFKDLSARFLK